MWRSGTPAPAFRKSEIAVVMSSFGRGTLAQKNAEEGSGLGLPIVKGLIELHGGMFKLEIQGARRHRGRSSCFRPSA